MLFPSFSFSKEFHLDSQDWAVCLHVSPSKAETNPERGIGIRRGAWRDLCSRSCLQSENGTLPSFWAFG